MLDESNQPIAFCSAGPRSPHWHRVRDEHLAAHPTCAACGGRAHLNVHHIQPFHLFPDLELDPKNFITLCENPDRHCHIRVGHSWNFSAYNPHVVEDAARELDRLQNRLTA